MKILLWLAASAVEEPEIPAKNTESSTLIWASAPRTSSVGFPHEHAEARDERFTEEDHPGQARDRPRREDERHRQLGELGSLVPAEAHELDSPPHEDQREHEDEEVGDDLQERVG